MGNRPPRGCYLCPGGGHRAWPLHSISAHDTEVDGPVGQAPTRERRESGLAPSRGRASDLDNAGPSTPWITIMIHSSLQDALNAQINREQYSAQLYLAMSAHCEAKSFRGFAHWLRLQAQEETAHAMKLIEFLLDRGGRLELKTIEAPPTEFGSLTDLFARILAHEQSITASINALFERSRAEKDYASEITLQWYVTEQVEEEASVGQILDQLRAIGEKGGGIWYLDSRMGKRVSAAR